VSFFRFKVNLKNILLTLILTSFFSSATVIGQPVQEADTIKKLLNDFHQAAASADFEAYFGFFNEDAVFMGTDASERWPVKEFKAWCKPHFDRKKTWHFTALQRHITLDVSGRLAWFDELLDTQMKICRGSGVLVKQDDGWKISQYVLSMTIPNEKSDSVIKMKAPLEDEIIEFLKKD